MKQYCRYCAYMVCGDANYCAQLKKIFTDKQICAANNCKLFEFNPEDALGTGHKYTPRCKKLRNDQIPGQVSLFSYMERDADDNKRSI